jgi:aspartyl-tRNA(Asn)/glutamyl-tRNA(Gln) amidotransferase subunit A
MDVLSFSIKELSAALRGKKISSAEVTRACLDKIKASKLNAVNYTAEESALKQAEAADRRIAAGNALPLTGVPLLIKDNICVKDMPATCSSKMLENYIPPYDAAVVERLKDAGAVLLGKTNMDEFAMGSSNETSYFGAVLNPADNTRVPGGSSGGSAAAVSGNLCFGALGSDTGGSIRQPAALCGAVGLKPTYGAVSRYGLIAFGSSLDQIGLLTRTVYDAALLLSVIGGYDKRDSTSQKTDCPDYLREIGGGLKGLKIGLPKEYFGEGLDAEVKEAVLRSAKRFEAAGAEVTEISLPYTDAGLSVYYVIACAEAASNLARFDGVRYGYSAVGAKDLEELYVKTRTEAFGSEVKRRIMLGNYVLSSGYYDAYYLKALKVRTLIRKAFGDAFQKCDALLGPTSPETAFKFGEKSADPLRMYLSDVYTVTANIAGVPAVSVPCGRDSKGLPIGLQLIAPAFGESVLLRAAAFAEEN